MDMVINWLVVDILLVIGFVTAGVLVESVLNRRADLAITKMDSNVDDQFSTLVRSLWLGNPRLLAIILRCPTFLSFIFVIVLVFFVLPSPFPTENTIPSSLFLLLFTLSFWIPYAADRAKDLRTKAEESKQTAGI